MDQILDANMNVLRLNLRTKRKGVLSRFNYFRETSHRKDSTRNAVLTIMENVVLTVQHKNKLVYI